MGKKVIIISTTMRKNGNSQILAEEFAKGAMEKGHDVELITLSDKEIKFCKGCLACQSLGHCVIQDDSNEIVEKMLNADVIVWATPVYYYAMSGQMKTLIDRANSMFTRDYKFRETYLITAAADTSESSADGVIEGLKGWLACYPKCTLKSVIRGVGVEAPGDVRKTSLITLAYETGKNI